MSYQARFPCGFRVRRDYQKEAERDALKVARSGICCKIHHDLFRVYELDADGKEVEPAVFFEDSGARRQLCWSIGHPQCNGNARCVEPKWRSYTADYLKIDGVWPVLVHMVEGLHRTPEELLAANAKSIPTSPSKDGESVRWYVWDSYIEERMRATARRGLHYPTTPEQWQVYVTVRPSLGDLLRAERALEAAEKAAQADLPKSVSQNDDTAT